MSVPSSTVPLQIDGFSADDPERVADAMRVFNEAAAVDAPFEHPWLAGQFAAWLRRGHDGEPPTPYLATVDGQPVGAAWLMTSARDNLHLAWVSFAVLPEHRRRGHGTRIFEHLRHEVQARGRTSIGTDGWDCPRTTAFAARVGLERKAQAVMRRQHLAEVPTTRLQQLYDEAATVAADYELVRIPGRTPPGLVDPMVTLASAINDAPTDDLDVEDEVFSAERLAAYEDATIEAGDRIYRLVARHRSTGELGGHSVVAVQSERPAVAEQHDTAVARAHRGHRLGLLLKAGMLLWLAEVEPQLETVDTWNAESNTHMIAVNEALGYRVMARELQLQLSW